MSPRFVRLIVFTALSCILLSCGSKPSATSSYPMGERVPVGRLVFRVLEADWKAEIEGAKFPPKNRFLQVRIAITNNGNQEVALPYLKLVDGTGKETYEFSDIETNSQWMGAIRHLRPAATEEGMIFFDVPVGGYKLEVIDGSDAENEKTAYVTIPAALTPPPQVPTPGSDN